MKNQLCVCGTEPKYKVTGGIPMPWGHFQCPNCNWSARKHLFKEEAQRDWNRLMRSLKNAV